MAHSHNGVAHAVASGEALLGIISPSGMRALPEALHEKLAAIAELALTLALVWLAHRRLGREVERIKSLLLRFRDSPEGREFMAMTGFKGLREIDTAELRALDPAAREVARLLRAAP